MIFTIFVFIFFHATFATTFTSGGIIYELWNTEPACCASSGLQARGLDQSSWPIVQSYQSQTCHGGYQFSTEQEWINLCNNSEDCIGLCLLNGFFMKEATFTSHDNTYQLWNSEPACCATYGLQATGLNLSWPVVQLHESEGQQCRGGYSFPTEEQWIDLCDNSEECLGLCLLNGYYKKQVYTHTISLKVCDTLNDGSNNPLTLTITDDLGNTAVKVKTLSEVGELYDFRVELHGYSVVMIEADKSGSDGLCIEKVYLDSVQIPNVDPFWLDEPCSTGTYAPDFPCFDHVRTIAVGGTNFPTVSPTIEASTDAVVEKWCSSAGCSVVHSALGFSSGRVGISIKGDFDSTDEYAEIFIDGVKQAGWCSPNEQCGETYFHCGYFDLPTSSNVHIRVDSSLEVGYCEHHMDVKFEFEASAAPTKSPSSIPSSCPSVLPTNLPSSIPSSYPSFLPSFLPSSMPSSIPTTIPTSAPDTSIPTSSPTLFVSPTLSPSMTPTCIQSVQVYETGCYEGGCSRQIMSSGHRRVRIGIRGGFGYFQTYATIFIDGVKQEGKCSGDDSNCLTTYYDCGYFDLPVDSNVIVKVQASEQLNFCPYPGYRMNVKFEFEEITLTDCSPSNSPSKSPSSAPLTSFPSLRPTASMPSSAPLTSFPSLRPTASVPSAAPTIAPSSPSTAPTFLPSSFPIENSDEPFGAKVQIDIVISGVTTENFELVKDSLASAIIKSFPEVRLIPSMISFIFNFRASRRQMSIATQEVITAFITLDSSDDGAQFVQTLNDFETRVKDQMNSELSNANVDVEVTSFESSLAVFGDNSDSSGSADTTTFLTLIVTGLIILVLVCSCALYYYWHAPEQKVELDIETEGRGVLQETRSISLKNHRFVIE